MDLHIRGVVLPEGAERELFVQDGRIRSERRGPAWTVASTGFVIPGLADVHVHLALRERDPAPAPPRDAVELSAREYLRAGVLALREPGGPVGSSRGVAPGRGLPRLVTGGRFLAPPRGYLPRRAREVLDEGLPQAAAEEAAESGAWAKVIGDWPGPDGRWRANYRPETLAQAATLVHGAGRRIAIHAFTPEVVAAAVEARFDSVEHGLLAGEEELRGMADGGIAFVPTMTILPGLERLAAAARSPRDEVARIRQGVRRHPATVRLAVEAGVTVLAGTDGGVVRHGIVAEEVGRMIAAGVSPHEALGTASWGARRFLGLPEIEEGAPADLVVLPEDPRRHPEVLRRPSVVILDGGLIAGGY